MDISVYLLRARKCFWASFTDEETEAGRPLMRYAAGPEVGCASSLSKSALWKEAGKLIPDEV